MYSTENFEDMPIKNLSLRENATIITIEIFENKDASLYALFEAIEPLNINLEMLCNQTTNTAYIVSFCIPDSAYTDTIEALKSCDQLRTANISIEQHINKIILVGIGFLTHKKMSSKIFKLLHNNNIQFSHIAMSEISLSFTVKYDDTKDAINLLAKELNL